MYNLDTSKKLLNEIQMLDLDCKPGAMVFGKDGRYGFVACGGFRKNPSKVLCFERGTDGRLVEKGFFEVPSKPSFLAFSRDERFILSSYYRTGGVRSHIIKKVLKFSLVKELITDKKAHCVRFHSDGNFFYVPHTGEFNKIEQFRFDKVTGNFLYCSDKYSRALSGAGPRHLLFSKSGDFGYSSNEQGSSIGVWRFSAKDGDLENISVLSSIGEILLMLQIEGTIASQFLK